MTIEYRCCSGTSQKPCCIWSNGCNIVGAAIPLFRAGSAWDFLSLFCYLLTGWMAKATSVQNLWQPRECQEQEGKGQLWGWYGITHPLPSSAVLWSPALWGIGAPVTEASCLWPPPSFPLVSSTMDLLDHLPLFLLSWSANTAGLFPAACHLPGDSLLLLFPFRSSLLWGTGSLPWNPKQFCFLLIFRKNHCWPSVKRV